MRLSKMFLRRSSIKSLGCLALVLFTAVHSVTANAIGNGKPDTGYVNVGALGVYLDRTDGKGPFGLCSGFVISDRAFVTAAHCLATYPEIMYFPEAWAVTLEPGSPEQPILPPGVFSSLDDISKFPIEVKTESPMAIFVHPDFDPDTFENDVAVLEFPAGTFHQPPVKLARPGYLKWLKRLGILRRLPIGITGYGATGFATNDVGQIIGLSIPGHRNSGFTALGRMSRTRLFLETTPVLDSALWSGDSGSPQFALDRAVSLSSVTGIGEQRLDIPAVRRFLAPFTR